MNQSFLFETEQDAEPKLPGYPCVVSPCGLYRYTCYRIWKNHADPRLVMFLMLNPSQADADQLDPTLKRCVAFAQAWGFDGMCVCNLFAFRATLPADMKAAADPIGDDCDYWTLRCAEHCEMVVAGFGNDGSHLNRARAVRLLFESIGKQLHYLKLNDDGSASHPLYLRADLTPKPWKFEREPIEPQEESDE
jgi:hypothetical protein